MNFNGYITAAITAVAALGFSSCSDNEPDDSQKVEAGTYSLSGRVEKGPFVRGSAISVQPLSEAFSAIGTVFNGELNDDSGSFNLGQIELASQYVRIATDGYYFNEVTGSLSQGQLHLVAYADLSDRSSVNVNILTHLKSARVQKLVKGGLSFAEADKQAQKELLTQFGLQAYEATPAEAMSITLGNDGAGVLIAISALMLNERSDAEITQYLSSLSQDLADDGSFTEANIKEIAIDRAYFRNKLDFVASNIKSRYYELGKSIEVPDLRYFFDWNGDGIAGNEINDNPQITLSRESVEFDYNGGTAEIVVSSNVALSLEKPRDPDGFLEEEPGSSISEDSFIEGFYKNNDPEGASMTCITTYEDGRLTITVPKSERYIRQEQTVVLHDLMGDVRVTIPVLLEAKPHSQSDSKPELGEQGRGIVAGAYTYVTSAISLMYYIERGYTGMYKYYDVVCPMQPYDSFNNRAFTCAYKAVNLNKQVIKSLLNAGYTDAIPFFTLLNAVTYTEMVDKWGNIGIAELAADDYSGSSQQAAVNTLRYLESELDNISSCFSERKLSHPATADDIFNMPKDVWRIAKANVYMALGEYHQAMPYLKQIVDGNRYTLSAGNEYEANPGTILFMTVPDHVMAGHTMSYYSYADVLLLLAECCELTGASDASTYIQKVANAKGIAVSGNNIADIDSLRKQLFLPRYFAFQKRNNLGDYATYQTLWPIPSHQLQLSDWQQNPGY